MQKIPFIATSKKNGVLVVKSDVLEILIRQVRIELLSDEKVLVRKID